MFIPAGKECLTHKPGKMSFGADCDARVVEPLLIKANTLLEAVMAMPVMPHIMAALESELIKRSIFGTAAIEGNGLAEEEVKELLEKAPESGDGDRESRARKEIANLERLYALLTKRHKAGNAVTEALIKEFHAVITDGLAYGDNVPGTYRDTRVMVGDADHGGVYTPPRILEDVKSLMAVYTEWLNGEDMLRADPLLRAACAHYYLGRIHPFRDGNGRTARFVEAWILHDSGYGPVGPMLSNYYYAHLDEYFSVFSETAKSRDMTAFFRFFLNGVYASLKDLQRRMAFFLKKLLMQDYIRFLKSAKEITLRRQILLDILVDDLDVITLDTLYTAPKFRALYAGVSLATARRDLKKLLGHGLLLKTEAGYALNLDAMSL